MATALSTFIQRDESMKSKHLIALAVLAVSTAASAQNLYGVVSAGVSKLSFDCGNAPTCDKTDTAFKLLGGYKFAPNWAGEIGYFDFGKAKLSGGGANLEIKANGFGGGVAYHQDIAPAWNFVGRLGIAQVKTKLSGSAIGIPARSATPTATSSPTSAWASATSCPRPSRSTARGTTARASTTRMASTSRAAPTRSRWA